MSRLLSTLAGALLASGLAASPAAAQLTQAFAPAGLGGGLTVQTFETSMTTPGMTISAPSGIVQAGADGYASGGTPSGLYGISAGSYLDNLTFTFAAPIEAFGLYFGNDDTCCSRGFTAWLDAYAGASLVGRVSVVANMNDLADQFLGFRTTAAVDRVTLRYGSGTEVGLYRYADDVQFRAATSTVPEPATVALVGGGLAALLVGARRRRTV